MNIVYFHNVLKDQGDAFDARCYRISRDAFRQIATFLSEHFDLVSLDEGLRRVDDPRALALTFDDGYAGVAEHAAPVLQELGVPAAVFVVSGTLDDAATLLHYEQIEMAFRVSRVPSFVLPELGWPQIRLGDERARLAWMKKVKKALRDSPEAKRQALQAIVLERMEVSNRDMQPGDAHRKMTPAALRDLQSRGWTIGAHTRTHRVIGRMSTDQARDEIVGSRADLEAVLGAPPRYFAFPYGRLVDVGAEGARLVREAGFAAGFTTEPGAIASTDDPFVLRRQEFVELLAMQAPSVQQKARAAFGP